MRRIAIAACQTITLGAIVFGILAISTLLAGEKWNLRYPQYWSRLPLCAFVWIGLGMLLIPTSRNTPPLRAIFGIVLQLSKLAGIYVIACCILGAWATEWQAWADHSFWNMVVHYFIGGVGLLTLMSWGFTGHHLDFMEEMEESELSRDQENTENRRNNPSQSST